MGYRDLREFLDKLEEEGQLVHYNEPIIPEPDIRAVCGAASEIGDRAPAVMMNNVVGYKGRRLAVNVHGSWANHALMLGMPKNATIKEQFAEMCKRWHEPGEVKWVTKAPCQEVVVDRDINLYHIIPMFRTNINDGGFYLSKASVVTRDPEFPDDFGKQNVGIYRIQSLGPDTLAMQGNPTHDIARQFKKAEMAGRNLPVAIFLGADPCMTMASATPLEYHESEYNFAANMNRQPLELVKCLTADLDVPAYAEFVLEGEIIVGERVLEGPFGEFPGSYSGFKKQLLVKVKTVTHRVDPIFENLYVSKFEAEHAYLNSLNTCVPLFQQVHASIPEVKAINAMPQHGQTCIVSTDVRFGGFAKTVAFRLLSTPHGTHFCRNTIIVDGDIDPFNLNEVIWALSTRVRDQKDIIIVPFAPGINLNPAADIRGMDRKLIIDATTTVPKDIPMDIKMIERTPRTDHYLKVLSDLQNAAAKK
jgi:UbiD family decarboxylase